tara:strand:- start:385 stop:609 length:225 start_codon:yes stop_codon:yes gene_type:complete
MKVLIYILFTIGIVMMTIGYINSTKSCPPRKIEYRYIPKKKYKKHIDQEHIDEENIYEEYIDKKNIDNVKHIFN